MRITRSSMRPSGATNPRWIALALNKMVPHQKDDQMVGTAPSVASADLCPDHFAGDDDFHAPVFLPAFVGAVVSHGFRLAQADGSHYVLCQTLLNEEIAHRVSSLLGKLHVRFVAADVVGVSF